MSAERQPDHPSKPRYEEFGSWLRRWLTAVGWVYFSLLFLWFSLYLLTGDRFPYLALANTLAVYFFFPLPVMAALAAWLGRRELWLGLLFGVVVFLGLWGEVFWPGSPEMSETSPRLVVMTYNVLGHHNQAQAVFDVIVEEAPDLVFLQELNPEVAAALEREMGALYPHQVLDPQPGVTGMGVISRFPLVETGVDIPLSWVGTPQVLSTELVDETVTLVNFHMFPSGLGTPEGVAHVYRAREEQARALAVLSVERGSHGPVVAAGDANVTDLNDAYRIVNRSLQDAWRQAGFGLGHTFPGSAIPGSARPRLAGVPVPPWLARIDYIFYSRHWQAVDARLARPDGYSDHRGVVAELHLLEK